MKTYTYISLTNRYPQPNKENPIRAVISVEIKKNFSIIVMNRTATIMEKEIFSLKEI